VWYICRICYFKLLKGAVHKGRPQKIVKNWPPSPWSAKCPHWLNPLHCRTTTFKKSEVFCAKKCGPDVRIWRTPFPAKCPHWTNFPSPNCGRLLWMVPKINGHILKANFSWSRSWVKFMTVNYKFIRLNLMWQKLKLSSWNPNAKKKDKNTDENFIVSLKLYFFEFRSSLLLEYGRKFDTLSLNLLHFLRVQKVKLDSLTSGFYKRCSNCWAWRCKVLGLGTVLIKLSRYLDQETAKGPFRSSSQDATCYYQSNHSKVEAIPLSVPCPRTQQANLPTYLHTIPF